MMTGARANLSYCSTGPPARVFSAAVVLAVGLALAGTARADVVILKNGDRLTGKAVHKKADELLFSTPYAGTITLKWSDVASLTTSKPVSMVLGNEHFVSGKLAEGAAVGHAALTLESVAAPSPQYSAARDIALDSISFLNPTVDESGRGIRWSGRVNAGGASTSGNTTNGTLHADVDLIGRGLHDRLIAGGEFNHATNQHEENVSNWRAHGEYDRFYTKSNFSYARTTFEHDKFKALDLRSTAGAGYGYQFFESPTLNLSLQGGIDYVNVNNLAAPDDDYAAAAWLLHYDEKPWNWIVQFFHQEDGTVSLESPSFVVLHTQTGLRAPLGGGINATLQLNYDWQNRPPPGLRESDRTLLFTLGYAW